MTLRRELWLASSSVPPFAGAPADCGHCGDCRPRNRSHQFQASSSWDQIINEPIKDNLGNFRGEKQRMHLRDGFLADQLDPIYVAYNMWTGTRCLKHVNMLQVRTCVSMWKWSNVSMICVKNHVKKSVLKQCLTKQKQPAVNNLCNKQIDNTWKWTQKNMKIKTYKRIS